MKKQLFNIPMSCSFADVLAEKFLREFEDNPLALTEVLILLPNRRAVKALKDAFVRAKGLTPTLLPRMMPLGDVEEDELFLSGGNAQDYLSKMMPSIGRVERELLFTKIIMAKPIEFGMEKMSLNQACFLAQELGNLIDKANNEELSFDKLETLVPDEYASHWQDTLKFLQIITHFWPDILAERNLIDASYRRRILLDAQAEIWQKNKTDKKIIVAGTTATFPAMKRLVQSVLDLPNGEVYLCGLDKNCDELVWNEIDESHPQFELKDLLDYLGCSRHEVTDLCDAESKERECFVSELMRPAKVSDKWLELKSQTWNDAAWQGIHLLNCADVREEALSIALLMRETLETPAKTAALVTSDRSLARRVAAELERWNIQVDDSAGRPLSLTETGIFLRILAQALRTQKRIDWLSLMKHPLFSFGMDTASVRRLVRRVENVLWRDEKEDKEAQTFWDNLQEICADFSTLILENQADFKTLLREHIHLAERLVQTPDKSGEQRLWSGESGEAAAHFVADLYEKAEVLGEISCDEYVGLFEALMTGVNVRPKFGGHPRLKILGPIEARLTHFDVTIIGEVNEGIWPLISASDPWMSRPMKKEFGFSLPEKAVGVMAFDFAQLLCGSEVYLSRAERVLGTPMSKSRWWLRLETLLKALNVDVKKLETMPHSKWAKDLDEPSLFVSLTPPAPRPPLEARPRELSASAVEKWMRNPYEIFARYILKLKPLEDIEKELDFSDYGTIVHTVLQEFNQKHPKDLPPSAREELLALGQAYFDEHQVSQEVRAFWEPSFEKAIDWFLAVEKDYRPSVERVMTEIEGKTPIKTGGRDFTLKAIADRVDLKKDGTLSIIDYKTGRARTEKEVRAAKAPQLPIEGIIAEAGGFGVEGRKVSALRYWQLGKKETALEEDVEEILEHNLEVIREYATLFELEETSYFCQSNPKELPEYSDYEHLARIKEWSVKDNDD